MLIIPKIGDWVNCHGKESQGKVTDVDLKKEKFSAIFFSEDGDPESTDTLPVARIYEIIAKQDDIYQLEKELRGEVAEVYIDPIYLLKF